MPKNSLIIAVVGVLIGFVGGFLLANSLNRRSETAMPSQSTSSSGSNTNSASANGELTLSDQEISNKIAEADENPTNFAFQKDLGVALYRYSAMKQDTKLLSESVRILERANDLKADDLDVLVALGNGHFDLGFANKDAASYQTARVLYNKALAIKPDDLDVQTDLGITYFLADPPEYDKAVAILQKVYRTDPKHTRSLQFLVQTFVKQGKIKDAEEALEKIKAAEPNNPAIAQLALQISSAKNGIAQ